MRHLLHWLKLSGLLFFSFCSLISSLHAQTFTGLQVELPFNVAQPVMAANILGDHYAELIIVGVDKQHQRKMAILSFDTQANTYQVVQELTLPEQYFAFDVGEPNKQNIQTLYLLAKNRVDFFQPKTHSFVLATQVDSLYRSLVSPSLVQQDFVRDINNDGVDDFIVYDFETIGLYLGQADSTQESIHESTQKSAQKKINWQVQLLPIASHLNYTNSGIAFVTPKIFFVDVNLDGNTDLLYAGQRELLGFVQQESGTFLAQGIALKTQQAFNGLNWWDTRQADGQSLDQSNLVYRVIDEVKDVNADGIIDIVARYTNSSGVLDKTNDYEFYFGFVQNQLLNDGNLYGGNLSNLQLVEFAAEPNSVITSEETLTGLNAIDVNGDGKLEILLSSFDIGLSEIISALLSGSIDQDVFIFALNKQDQYYKKPIVSDEVELNFSLSKGQTGAPMIKTTDVNGDKRLDLLLSDGDDRIKVLLATDTEAVSSSKPKYFAKRAYDIEVVLPKSANQIQDHDLNGDGKYDLLLHYGSLDGEARQQTITILFAD